MVELNGIYSQALYSQHYCMKWIAWALMRVYCFFCGIAWKKFTCCCHFPLCSAIYSIISPVMFVLLASRAELHQPSVTISTFLQGRWIRTTVPRLLCRFLLLLIDRTEQPVKPAVLLPPPPLPSIFSILLVLLPQPLALPLCIWTAHFAFVLHFL